MAEKNVLDETKKVLELMSESEEAVSQLEVDLDRSKTLCQQIQDNLKELRTFKNNSAAQLEDDRFLKDLIKSCNNNILSFAQEIYTCIQELYINLNTHDNELIKNEDLLCSHDDLFEAKLKEYEEIKASLNKQLELIENEEMENMKKKELEVEALKAENEEMQEEVTMLNEKIAYCENYIKSESNLDDEEKKVANTIQELHEHIKLEENKIDELQKIVDEEKQLREKELTEVELNIIDLDKSLEESETVAKETSSCVEICRVKIDEMCEKIDALEVNNKLKEKELENLERELNDLEKNLENLETDNAKTITNSEYLLAQNETMYKQQENIRENLKAAIYAFEEKIKARQEFAEKMEQFLRENKITEADLTTEVAVKENLLKELKTGLEELKESYTRKVSQVEEELKREEEEIATKEATNRKIEEDTNAYILELDRLKNDVEEQNLEKERQSSEMDALDAEISSLNVEVLEKKAKNKKNLPNLNVSMDSVKEKRPRHWDSDSSIEGEDRRFSELVKQKMKHKKGKTATPKGN